jgi:hypothetical protein
VVVDAGRIEPVSTSNSLITGKITGNFENFGPSAAIFASDRPGNSNGYDQIPYATEQGIFGGGTGNFLTLTGKLYRYCKRPLFARLFCACRTRSVLTGLFCR